MKSRLVSDSACGCSLSMAETSPRAWRPLRHTARATSPASAGEAGVDVTESSHVVPPVASICAIDALSSAMFSAL